MSDPAEPPRPASLVEKVAATWERCEAHSRTDPAVWIHRLTLEELREHARRVEAKGLAGQPLYGLTFAIKDNIDLAGAPTTAGCPGFSRIPPASAAVVAKLMDAGAIPIGKTNMDQFATGLVGTRSPYGAPRNVFNREYISGGSSSGSAVAVAAGLVDFALGTDTAGSGRVPAALNGLVGVKPTRGLLSSRGVIPACRSLDCVSVAARDIAGAMRATRVAAGFDAADPWSRRPPGAIELLPHKPKCGVPRPDQLEWFGNPQSPELFKSALAGVERAGGELTEIDFSPFLGAAKLLYEGPWTAERYAAVGRFIEEQRDNPAAGIDPVVAGIILGGRKPSAADAFEASHRLAELRRKADEVFSEVDFLAAPTIGTVYTVAEVAADPVRRNSNLGTYTNFMNLLDLCGLALPAGRYGTGPGFGITLVGAAWSDERLADFGTRLTGGARPHDGHAAPPGWIELAVCGAHLRGQPLNGQLASLGARFVAATTTSPRYRLYSLANAVPQKPGLVRDECDPASRAIEIETFALSPGAFGLFVASVPPPLTIGTVELADGRWVKGFLCEPRATSGATEITRFGGWIAYRRSRD